MNDTVVTLRAVEPDDWQFMFETEQDPAVSEYSAQTAPLSKELLRQYALTYDADPFSAGQLRLIAVTADGTPVGIADFFDISPRHSRAECGICIAAPFRGKGYGKKVLEVMKDFALTNMGLSQLTATIAEDNAAALAAFQSAGFSPTGYRPKWWRSPSGLHDVIILNSFLTK